MAFSVNSSQQISIFDATANLTQREIKMLEKSWAIYFAENIFPAIDEEPFKILYSDRPSRHNTPVNVIIGALIIKEIFQLTDKEIVETLPFDIRYQYALHTTSFEEQPLNDRTLGRFRARCNTYEERTGIDLIHQCIVGLSSEMAKLMKINTGMRRMDSLMVASNIKKMSRLELLYTCVANLAKFMRKSEDGAFPESLIHYTEEDDHNRVLYHNRSEDTESKITQVLKDAAQIITACGSRYDESSEYQLLIRVIEEQTDKGADGNLILKSGKSDMNSGLLQNPADPDATFRTKAGKDYLDKQPVSEEGAILVTDGGYCGYEKVKQAAEKNVDLITTDLKGTDVADIYADFKFSEDGKEIISCSAGHKPKSNVYDINTQKCKASFPIEQCKGCKTNFLPCRVAKIL